MITRDLLEPCLSPYPMVERQKTELADAGSLDSTMFEALGLCQYA